MKKQKNRIRFQWISSVSVMLLSLLGAYTQSLQIEFQHLTTKDGLLNNAVNRIIQDYKGFMWFGTNNGLQRYDGYELKNYLYSNNDSISLSGNLILDIIEDKEKNLWIGTNQGFDLYDRCKDSFIHVPFVRKATVPDESGILPDSVIHLVYAREIYEDQTGNILISSGSSGILRLDRQSLCLRPFLPIKDILSLYQDAEKILWIGTQTEGLAAFDEKGDRVAQYRHAKDDPESIADNYVHSITEDNRGNLWIGTENGLCLFKRDKGNFKRFRNQPDDNSSLSGNRIRTIFQDSRGKLWIGASPGGLNIYDPDTGRFARIQHDRLNGSSLSSDMVIHVYEDRQGNLWIGTLEGGINFTPFYSSKGFTAYRNEPANSNSLNVNSIHAIEEDRNGNLWLGTEGGGLNCMDRKTGGVIHYKNKPGDPTSICTNAILCVMEDSRGDIWAGGYAGGISRLDKKTGAFSNFQYQTDNPNGISHSDVRCLFEDSQKNFWIATNGGGINLFDRDRRVFTHFRNDSSNVNSISSDWCLTVYEDSKGALWFGTYWGLNRYDKKTRTFTRFFNDKKDKTTISNDWIYCILEDFKGNLWIGTYYGLNLFHPLTNTFTSYTQEDGLPNDVINGILEDKDGSLWLSTDKGLAQFDPESRKCTVYDYRDGLAGDQFNHGARFKDSSGKMFFGGVDGLTAFDPEKIRLNSFVPPVVITGLIINNKQTGIHRGHSSQTMHTEENGEITLTPDESMITFQFSALNFVNPEKNHYAYIMKGFDKQWNEVGPKREATYTNLDPGSYIFQVKGSNNDGIWNRTGASIRVVVLPPWWKTWWFRIGMIGIIGLTILAIFELRLRSIKRHQRQLAKEVEQRTHELNKANQLLSQSNAELEQFAYVASHDLQEPLRMVSSYMGLLSKRYQDRLDDDAREFIGFAMDGSKRMQQLINDLLSYSRVSTQGKPFETTDVEEVFKCVTQNLQVAIEESGARVTHDALPMVMADRIQLERLFQNLVGNAIKYRDKGAVPSVHVTTEQKDGEWVFSIRDNGIGIDPKHFDRIFGIFQRLHTRNQYSGTGIGLAVCKKIVERHKGRIWVESEEGKGSTFRFTLSAYDSDMA